MAEGTRPLIRLMTRDERRRNYVCYPSIVGAGRSHCVNPPKWMVEGSGYSACLCGVHAVHWKRVYRRAYGEDPPPSG